jgi:hypothetical protein
MKMALASESGKEVKKRVFFHPSGVERNPYQRFWLYD